MTLTFCKCCGMIEHAYHQGLWDAGVRRLDEKGHPTMAAPDLQNRRRHLKLVKSETGPIHPKKSKS